MSQIILTYSWMDTLIEDAKDSSKAIDKYISSINSNIKSPSGTMTGSDDNGYISTVSSLAQTKMDELLENKTKLDNFATKVQNLEDLAKTEDTAVSSRIEELADAFVGKRNWLQNKIDWIYDTFCVDMANNFAIFRAYKYLWKVGKTAFEYIEVGMRKARDWFKYGNGRYVLKIAGAIVGVVAAIAGVVAAVVALPAVALSAPFIIAVIGAVASGFSTLILVGNAIASVYSNGKAIKLSHQGELGAARYYSDVEKISDAIARKDYGDEKDNTNAKGAGQFIDKTKEVLDTVKTITDFASLGFVKNPDGKISNQYKFKYDNIVKNIGDEMGIVEGGGKLKPGSITSFISRDELKKYKMADTARNKIILGIINGDKTINNLIKFNSAITSLGELGGKYDYELTSKDRSKLWKNLGTIASESKPLKAFEYLFKGVSLGYQFDYAINGN